MNCKFLNALKKLVTGVTVVVVMLTSTIPMVVNAETASEVTTDLGIVYKPYSKTDFEKLVGNTAPTYEGDAGYGYLFGGWYKTANETNVIKTKAEAGGAETVYAKFVPSYVMSVKCQNHSTTKSSDARANIRIVSSVDSANYSEVGFIVDRVYLNSDGSYNKETVISNGTAVGIYTGNLLIYDNDGITVKNRYQANAVFGKASSYFTALNLNNISNFNMVVSVQPYWKTLDGTQVLGLTRYVRVNDGINGYVSVPVNLSSATDVAAGLLTVDYSSMVSAGYKLEFVEGGKVFEEMNHHIIENTVKCVGNISDISANAKSNDIFINLRFKAPDTERIYSAERFYQLTVTGESFTNITEDKIDAYDVWDIQY